MCVLESAGTVGVALGMEESIPYGIKEPAKTEFLPFLQDLNIEKISFPSNGIFADILPDHFIISLGFYNMIVI